MRTISTPFSAVEFRLPDSSSSALELSFINGRINKAPYKAGTEPSHKFLQFKNGLKLILLIQFPTSQTSCDGRKKNITRKMCVREKRIGTDEKKICETIGMS